MSAFLVLAVIIIFVVSSVPKFTKGQVDSIVDVTTPPKQETGNTGQNPTLPPTQEEQLTPSAGSGVVQCSVPTGFFSVVYLRQRQLVQQNFIGMPNGEKLDVAGIFKYIGNCPTDIYLEAGIVNQPLANLLSFLPDQFNIRPTGAVSNCDGNTHFNGAVYHVEPGQDIKFRFAPENYGVEAAYPINIGAYWGGRKTGCLADGGSTLVELHSQASFSNSYSLSDLLGSYKIIS